MGATHAFSEHHAMDSDTPSLHEEIIVNEDLQAFIDPLTPEEDAALEQSLLTEGCRDALVLWGQVLVDGHNRFRLCRKHGLPFRTVQNPRFKSLEDVQLWMIDQHLGRRSLSNFQRGVLALRKRELLAEKKAQRMAALAEAPSVALPAQGEAAAAPATAVDDAAPWEGDTTLPAGAAAPASMKTLDSREDIAKAARLSSAQVQMIEKIQKQAAPEVVAAVRAGELSINAAAVVASLPAEEQVAAAHAGADELKQVAKRVRESKRKPKTVTVADPAPSAEAESADGSSPETLETLRQRVATLEAENAELRREIDALRASAQG